MRRRPLLALAIGFALGSTLPAVRHSLVVGAGSVALALSPPLAPIGFLGAGWVAASSVRLTSVRAAGETTLEGRVASVPERLGDRVRFQLRENDGRLIRASAVPLPWPLALGDRIRMTARLRSPEGPRNPGGRDRAGELAARGIGLEAIATAAPVRVAPPALLGALERARDRFARDASLALPPREAGLVRAIATGDRGGIDPDTSDAFARSGLAHLLSVSGLHLAVVALGAHRALRWALARCDAVVHRVDPRRMAAAATLPITALYAVATGADVPVVRSAIAAAVGIGGVLLDREVDALDALALAGLVVLAADPGALLDPSFQLSFVSVAGLALWSGPLRRALPVPRLPPTLAGRAGEALLAAVCASAAATLATTPIVACHFRRLSLLAVASNLPGVPIGSALTVAAALAALAGTIAPPLSAPLLLACRPLATLLLAVNDVCASPRWATVAVGSPGLLGAACCYGALLVAWKLHGSRRVLAAAAAAAALLLPPPLHHLLAVRRGGLEVTFLSVGQGDATAFLLPDGSAVLVDGGGEVQGRYDPGERDVVPWLRDAGVRRIAALFLSHPHPDHLLGLPAVAAAFPVERFFTNGRSGDAAAQAALARLPPAEVLSRGMSFERAGVRFEALASAEGHEAWTDNDASLVLRVTYGRSTFLMLGDVEAEGEAALLAADPARVLADVVKIAHHGSATSSTPALVGATGARWAVAAVGHDNRFGFPAAGVVERWQERGAQVLRTDEGAIRFLSNGSSVRRTSAAVSLDALALARERL